MSMNSVILDKTDMLIAKFMECEFYDDGRVCYSTEVDDYVTEDPMWDSSWDWIMPVVSKCFEVSLTHGFPEHSKVCFHCINDALLETNIDSLYKAVVEFIVAYKHSLWTRELIKEDLEKRRNYDR